MITNQDLAGAKASTEDEVLDWTTPAFGPKATERWRALESWVGGWAEVYAEPLNDLITRVLGYRGRIMGLGNAVGQSPVDMLVLDAGGRLYLIRVSSIVKVTKWDPADGRHTEAGVFSDFEL